MTDEDRYGRKLGTGFEAIRGRLCSPENQESAPDAMAAYMLRHFLKEMSNFKDWITAAIRAIDTLNSFFDDVDALERMKRTTNGSLAEDHFIQSMKEVIDKRDDAREILRCVAARGVDSYRHIIKTQASYMNDTACQKAFATLAPEINRCFANRLFAKAGLAPTVLASIRPKEDTRSLLDLPIVSKSK